MPEIEPTCARILSDSQAFEAFVGERVTFALVPTFLTVTIEVTSSPAGSSPVVDGDGFTPDVSGTYRVTVRMGTAVASRAVAVFPREALDNPRLRYIGRGCDAGRERPMRERRLVLRSLAQALASAELETLTPERPLPTFDLAPYGAE